MLIDLAQFASLLLALLAVDALLHTAFFAPGSSFRQQLVPLLEMLLLAGAVCFAAGRIFVLAAKPSRPVHRTLPMQVFWWGGTLILLFFLGSWYVERYVIHLWP